MCPQCNIQSVGFQDGTEGRPASTAPATPDDFRVHGFGFEEGPPRDSVPTRKAHSTTGLPDVTVASIGCKTAVSRLHVSFLDTLSDTASRFAP